MILNIGNFRIKNPKNTKLCPSCKVEIKEDLKKFYLDGKIIWVCKKCREEYTIEQDYYTDYTGRGYEYYYLEPI